MTTTDPVGPVWVWCWLCGHRHYYQSLNNPGGLSHCDVCQDLLEQQRDAALADAVMAAEPAAGETKEEDLPW